MDVTSRRAFSLDSRTVWVEQQLINQVLLPKDNLVLGPGEYTPKIPERNVSTPSLGRYRTPADHFRPFKSSASGARSIGSSRSPDRPHTTNARRDSVAAGSTVSLSSSIAQTLASNRSEFSTIYHNYDDRNPFDPKTHFTETPDPYLGQDTIFESKKHDGIVKLKNTLPFGPTDVPFGERNPTREALPDYEVNFDSIHFKPKPKFGKFPVSKRIHIPTEEEMKQSASHVDSQDSPSKVKLRPIQPAPSTSEIASQTGMSVFEIRCNLVPLPKLKTRAPPKLVLDDSCYRNSRIKQPVVLTPSVVKKQARLNLFEKIPCIPRAHRSVDFLKPSTSSPYDR